MLLFFVYDSINLCPAFIHRSNIYKENGILKRIFALCIILFFVFAFCTACSGVETSGTKAAASEAEAASIDVEAKESDVSGSMEPIETDSGPVIPDGISVSSFDEFKKAASDSSTNVIIISGDVDINEEKFVFEPEKQASVYITDGSKLTVSTTADLNNCAIFNYGSFAVTEAGDLLMIGNEEGTTTFTNDGTIEIAGKLTIPYINLMNNGSVSIQSTGSIEAAQMTYENGGEFILEDGGNLNLSKGCIFQNSQSGTLLNRGYILVDDGGNLNNESGAIVNNGTIDIYTYFTGEIEAITGSGTINDYREE